MSKTPIGNSSAIDGDKLGSSGLSQLPNTPRTPGGGNLSPLCHLAEKVEYIWPLLRSRFDLHWGHHSCSYRSKEKGGEEFHLRCRWCCVGRCFRRNLLEVWCELDRRFLFCGLWMVFYPRSHVSFSMRICHVMRHIQLIEVTDGHSQGLTAIPIVNQPWPGNDVRATGCMLLIPCLDKPTMAHQ